MKRHHDDVNALHSKFGKLVADRAVVLLLQQRIQLSAQAQANHILQRRVPPQPFSYPALDIRQEFTSGRLIIRDRTFWFSPPMRVLRWPPVSSSTTQTPIIGGDSGETETTALAVLFFFAEERRVTS